MHDHGNPVSRKPPDHSLTSRACSTGMATIPQTGVHRRFDSGAVDSGPKVAAFRRQLGIRCDSPRPYSDRDRARLLRTGSSVVEPPRPIVLTRVARGGDTRVPRRGRGFESRPVRSGPFQARIPTRPYPGLPTGGRTHRPSSPLSGSKASTPDRLGSIGMVSWSMRQTYDWCRRWSARFDFSGPDSYSFHSTRRTDAGPGESPAQEPAMKSKTPMNQDDFDRTAHDRDRDPMSPISRAIEADKQWSLLREAIEAESEAVDPDLEQRAAEIHEEMRAVASELRVLDREVGE